MHSADRPLYSEAERFRQVTTLKTRVVNIHEFPFKGGCISCFSCAANGDCIYKDGFQELLRGNIQQSDAIVLAFSIKDHSMGSVFFGVGGMKIFRDLIWLMQGMMKADHRFYKKHNQYDFPQKKTGQMLKMYLVGGLISNPEIKKKMGNKMSEGMIAPYKRVLNENGESK